MSNSQHRCVFVGNIPYDATEEQLIQICEEVGPVVSFRLVLDRDTGKPKGYGFCEFRDEETALSARRNLQGYEINGRQLRVDFAENEKGVDRNREQGRGGPGLTSTLDAQKQASGVRASGDPSFNQPVGIAVAAAAAAVMAGALGGSQVSVMNSASNGQPNSGAVGIAGGAVCNDPLTNHLASMSKHQLFEIVSQMKELIQQNHQQTRQILVANPQLTKALFQTQIILGLVRPSQVIPNIMQSLPQNVPTLPHPQTLIPQQQAVPPPHMQASQTQPVQPPSMQTSPMQPQPLQPVQQGQMPQPQMPVVQNPMPQNSPIHTQMQGIQQSQTQIPTSQSSQSLSFQHHMQALQQSQNALIQPTLQNVSQLPPPTVNMQPRVPHMQLIQPQQLPLQHSQPTPLQQSSMPPQHLQLTLSQLSRPPALPQVQSQPIQSMGFQLPPVHQQAPLPQPTFQLQQHGGMPQSTMGMQYQPIQPPLPNQPPPQQSFQMSHSGADMSGGPGNAQSGLPSSVSMLTGGVSMGLGGHQLGGGPGMGGPNAGPVPPVTWNQVPQSGTIGGIAGVPHSSAPMVMAGHGGASQSMSGVNGGIALLLPGGSLPSSATLPMQQDIKTHRGNSGVGGSSDGSSMSGVMLSQGYDQEIQPPSQVQQPPQMQLSPELEQQNALLQQVMNLTPEQINSLPPEQRQQVIQLQQAFRS